MCERAADSSCSACVFFIHLHAREVVGGDGRLHQEVVEDERGRDALPPLGREAHARAKGHQLGGGELGSDLLVVHHDEVDAVVERVEDGALAKVAVHAAGHHGLADRVRRRLDAALEQLLRQAEGRLQDAGAELRVCRDLRARSSGVRKCAGSGSRGGRKFGAGRTCVSDDDRTGMMPSRTYDASAKDEERLAATMLRMAVRKGDASEVVAVHVLSASRSRCAMFVARCSGVKMESFYSVFCKRPDL